MLPLVPRAFSRKWSAVKDELIFRQHFQSDRAHSNPQPNRKPISMQKLLPGLLLASLVTIPLEANAAQFESADVRTGTFVGARFKMRLGGRSPSRPTASLAIAPTLSRTLTNGEVRTSISESATLSLGARPTISLMGIRVA